MFVEFPTSDCKLGSERFTMSDFVIMHSNIIISFFNCLFWWNVGEQPTMMHFRKIMLNLFVQVRVEFFFRVFKLWSIYIHRKFLTKKYSTTLGSICQLDCGFIVGTSESGRMRIKPWTMRPLGIRL